MGHKCYSMRSIWIKSLTQCLLLCCMACASSKNDSPRHPSSLEDDDFAQGATERQVTQPVGSDETKLPPFLRDGDNQEDVPEGSSGANSSSGKKDPRKNATDRLVPLPSSGSSGVLQGQAGFQCKDNGQFYDNNETYRMGCLVCRCTAGKTFSRVQCRELTRCGKKN
jgi:hypothetical protein